MYKAEFFSNGVPKSEAMIDAINGSVKNTSKSTVTTANPPKHANAAGETWSNMADAKKNVFTPADCTVAGNQ